MPEIPVGTILAKDLIGQALELSFVEDARLLGTSVKCNYYNMSLSFIHAILLYIDNESLLTEIVTTNSAGQYPKHRICDYSATAYNDIMAVSARIASPLKYFECFRLSVDDFLKHKANQKAMYPYSEAIVYTELNQRIDFIVGESITENPDDIVFTAYMSRSFTVLVEANYATEYVDIPAKYYGLLILLIAAFSELRKGINDKSFGMVKVAVELLLANVEPAVKSKIMTTLFRLTGEK